MDILYRIANAIYDMASKSAEAIDLMVTGWKELPGQIYPFLTALGPAGDVLLTVLSLCVGYLVLRLLITVVELIPGF